jgi:hypothetical protein
MKLGELFYNDPNKDFVIYFEGTPTSMRAHKIVLADRSAYFKDMFNFKGDISETIFTKDQQDQVTLDVFEVILRSWYDMQIFWDSDERCCFDLCMKWACKYLMCDIPKITYMSDIRSVKICTDRKNYDDVLCLNTGNAMFGTKAVKSKLAELLRTDKDSLYVKSQLVDSEKELKIIADGIEYTMYIPYDSMMQNSHDISDMVRAHISHKHCIEKYGESYLNLKAMSDDADDEE